MKEYKEITDELKATVMPKFIALANAEVEIDIVRSFEYDYFPETFETKTFRELIEVIIRPYYRSAFDELYRDAIDDNWGYTAFNYGSIVEQIVEESVKEDMRNFIEQCYETGKYINLFKNYADIEEDEDNEWIVDFCCDLYDCEFYLNLENIPIYEENPTVSELLKKYSSEIEAYRTALSKYNSDENWFNAQLIKEASHIVVPNFRQKITKNDTDLLKFLKENFSKREITLMIQMHKILVSNSIASQYPAIYYPKSRPNLRDFILKSDKLKFFDT